MAQPVKAAGKTDWREQYAYTLVMQAYIFGFPYVYLPTLRWDWVTRPKSPHELPHYAPINHFSHVKTLADASYRAAVPQTRGRSIRGSTRPGAPVKSNW